MIVDAHLHVWRGMQNYPNPLSTILSPASDIPVDVLLEYMAEFEVDRAVLVQPTYPGEDNSYVADCAAADRDRFVAVCVVDPRMPGAEDRLEYWVRERGCRGLRLRPRIPAESAVFGDPATYPLWERARTLKIAINVLANPEHLAALQPLVDRFSDVPILVDHMAHPDVSAGVRSPEFQRLLALSRYPKVCVKPTGYYYYSRSAYPYADCHDFFRALYDSFGPSRLVWGSDFPHVLLKTGYRRNMQLQQRAYPFLTSADLALMLGENAAQIYWS